MMRGDFRSMSALCALSVALVVLWPFVPQAAAAEGSFTYTNSAGVSKTSANPPDDSCIALVGSGEVHNRTNVSVGFYWTADCKNRVGAVDRDSSGSVSRFASILFSERNAPVGQVRRRTNSGEMDRSNSMF